MYPKKSSGIETDLSRDHGGEPLDALSYRLARQIVIKDAWFALRFREKSLVKKWRHDFGPPLAARVAAWLGLPTSQGA